MTDAPEKSSTTSSDHWYKPGESGNPSGRPPTKPTTAETLHRILNDPIRVREGERTRRLRPEEVQVRQLVKAAMTGNVRANAFIRELQVEGAALKLDKGKEVANKHALAYERLARLLPHLVGLVNFDERD